MFTIGTWSTPMIYLFGAAAIAGIVALAMVPHHKDRARRLMQRGGAAALFGIGLCGTLATLVIG